MNADYQHLNFEKANTKINAYWVKSEVFGFHWHYHPEVEITYIKNGRGTRLVGDNLENFQNGDFVLMGSNLPHTWISDDDFNQSKEQMDVGVLQFHPSIFHKELFQLPEFKYVKKALDICQKGLVIPTEESNQTIQLLEALIEASGIHKYLNLVTLLDHIGQCKNYRTLTSHAYAPSLNIETESRILTVCRYIHEHFTEPIKLEQVAYLVSMNTSSFCRFFKKSTGQSLTEYINDLRVNKACNLLLMPTDKSIAEIGFESGFKSQTLFNRVFLKKKNCTPTQFKRIFK